MQFGGPAKYARRVLAVERPQRETTAQGGVGGLVVSPVRSCSATWLRAASCAWPSTWVRRAAQGVLIAQDRVAQLGRRRVQVFRFKLSGRPVVRA
jgi:hypothetical protein